MELLGIFWFRMLNCSLCSAGFLLLAFYETNNLLLFPGLVFIAFSQGTIYLTDAIAASLFGRYEALSVILFAGAFDASSGIPLILKKIYPAYSLSQMLFFMTALSSIIHLRTFFQMPFWMPNESFDSGAILKNTVFGKCTKKLKMRNAVLAIQKKEPVLDAGKCFKLRKCFSNSSLLESAKKPVFIIYTIVYIISSNRARTISGWMYPWLQWTYANSENASSIEIAEHVSGILDIYGYLTFAAPLFALLPELILTLFLLIKKG